MWSFVGFECLCVFVLASWSKVKSGPKEKVLKLESVLSQEQHFYDLDSLDNLCWPRRMGMGVISLSYIPWQH